MLYFRINIKVRLKIMVKDRVKVGMVFCKKEKAYTL